MKYEIVVFLIIIAMFKIHACLYIYILKKKLKMKGVLSRDRVKKLDQFKNNC